MSNEVAKKDNVIDLASLSKEFGKKGEIKGMEVLDASDLRMPRVRLLQSNSLEVTKQGMKAGQFYNTVTKTAVDKLVVNLLVMGKSRVMWPDKFKRGDEPLCRSIDNIKSFDGTKSCAKCPYADWDKAKLEGKNKPDCTMSYSWLCLDRTTKAPFRITAGGMSAGPTKDFINVLAPECKKYGLGIFVYIVEITSKQEENENGVFYTMQYKKLDAIHGEEYAYLEGECDSMRELFNSAMASDTLANDEHIEAEQTAGTNGGLF